MHKIGLALSGGGLRATLYHLGVIRFLRDAGALPDVTHITSVSGGSILAAHLVLNWDRYNGTDEQFEEAAGEVLGFARLDVRNRIVRRYPFLVLRAIVRWIARRPSDRRLGRTGLLEAYYEKYLYGDTCLYELPERPELHMLATNLSEGCICSFTRSGLIMQHRLPGDRVQFERIQAGLATVPLAVAASSAFPGFFPPIKLRAGDIGASESAFAQQAFTDGGVFDNLGIRAFRFIERCWSEECRPTDAEGREVEVEKVSAGADPTGAHSPASADRREASDRLARAGRGRASSSREIVRRADVEAAVLEMNEDIEDEAERYESYHRSADQAESVPGAPPPVRPTAAGFDLVLASDAGAKLSIRRDAFTGGLIQTALRASDILMDRVWQLEKEIFGAAPGFLFAPIHRIVEPKDDPHALLPVVQKQVVGMRTDMDRFSDEEIRGLVRHGYCVARQAWQDRPGTFDHPVPDGPAWDPIPRKPATPRQARSWRGRPPREETVVARELSESAPRRIWGTLLDWKDGMTYLFAPFMLALLLIVPFLIYLGYSSTVRSRQVLGLIRQSDPDEARVLSLLRDGPVRSVPGLKPRVVERLEAPDYRNFEILSDSHILDLRRWGPGKSYLNGSRGEWMYHHRRFAVRRTDAVGEDRLRLQFASRSDSIELACQNKRLNPILSRVRVGDVRGDTPPTYRWELALDFRRIPIGETVEVVLEQIKRPADGQAPREGDNALLHVSNGVTRVASMWILMPSRRPAGHLQLSAYETGRPRNRKVVNPTRMFEALDGAVVGWQIIGPDPDTTYEGHWMLD